MRTDYDSKRSKNFKTEDTASENLNTLIERSKPSMTKTQLRIADFILDNIDDVGFLSYGEISKGANVSDASLIRFLRSLGLERFFDFKALVKRYMNERTAPAIRMRKTISEIQSNRDIYANTFSIDMAMLKEVKEHWSESAIRSAVNLIEEARRIFVIGFGVSRSIVEFIDFRFNRLGYPVTPVKFGGAEIIEKLARANSSDLIITVGFFRPHREMSIVYRLAGDRDIPIVTITDSFSSPLKEGASVVLHARRGSDEVITSLVAPMSVANALSLSLARDDVNKALESFSELNELKAEFGF